MNLNTLDPESRQALMTALAVMKGRSKPPGMVPQQFVAATGMPDMAALPEGEYKTSPTALAGMLAQRDKRSALPSVDDYVATPLMNNDDESLVRSQYLRGGALAGSILESDDGPRPELRGGMMSYAGIKPVRGPEELLRNPKFQRLAQTSPAQAAKLYTDLTGGDFRTDIQNKQKQNLSMRSTWQEGIQKGLLEGNMRRHPTMGWLERRRTAPSIVPGEPAQEFWEPAESTLQQADRDYGETGTGYARPRLATLLDDIPPAKHNNFLKAFYEQKKAGKGDHEAITAANSIIETQAVTPAQLATLQNVPAVMKNPEAQKVPPVAYPEQAAARAMGAAGQQIGDWAWNNAIPAVANAVAGTVNIGSHLPNMVTKGANIVGALAGAKSRIADPLPGVPYVEDTNKFLDDLGWGLMPEWMDARRKQETFQTPRMGNVPEPVIPNGVDDGLFSMY